MHGQIDSILSHVPSGSNNLIVTGRLVADTPTERGTKVKEIKATLTINGGTSVDCNTNTDAYGNEIYPSDAPGTPWTMHASTMARGTATGAADAFDDNGKAVAHWTQPPAQPPIVVY
jgi:hypothetical protein